MAGNAEALEGEGALRRILAIIRADNPLGDFGLYRGVVEISFGLESFVPTDAADPALGASGEASLSPTVILTTYIAEDAPEDLVMRALEEILAAHPWEVPVVEVYPTTLLVRG